MGSGRGLVLNCKLIVLVSSYQGASRGSCCGQQYITMAVPGRPLGKRRYRALIVHKARKLLLSKALVGLLFVLVHPRWERPHLTTPDLMTGTGTGARAA